MKLVKSTDPILKEKVEEATSSEMISYFEDSLKMHAIMDSKDALGLAAPQVGLKHRMFVMKAENRTVINPEITASSEDTNLYDEGCLSFPYLWLKIKRPVWVEVKYFTFDDRDDQDEDKNFDVIEKEERLYGIDCQCFCHELDHLNGITFDDLAPSLSLKVAKKKQRNLLKKVKNNYGSHRVSRIRSNA